MNKYIEECEELLKESNCCLIHFGSVLVQNKFIIGRGYNWSSKLICETKCLKDKLDKKIIGKNSTVCYAVHSEWMALIDALQKGYDPRGSTLYIVGRYPDGKLWKSKFFTCTICARLLKYCGVKNIIGLQFGNEKDISIEEVFKNSYEHVLGVSDSNE